MLFLVLFCKGRNPLVPKLLEMILGSPRWMDLGLNVTVTEPSARLRPMNVRGEPATQLMKSILGLIALDRVTQTQCSMAIGPLVKIRS